MTHHHPEHALAHPVPLPRRPRELEGGVHTVHLQPHALVQALHEVGVSRGKHRHWQYAYGERPVIAPAKSAASGHADGAAVHAQAHT